MTLEELAAKCEAAGGPDGDLDQMVGVAIRNIDREGQRINSLANCPRYTASIDAALTLVPEGYDKWAVSSRNSAVVCKSSDPASPLDWVFASTPALALCAAALRAYRQKGPNR